MMTFLALFPYLKKLKTPHIMKDQMCCTIFNVWKFEDILMINLVKTSSKRTPYIDEWN